MAATTGTKKCPKCKYTVKASARKCPHCGAKVG
jgi:ssDNA-binding Zn-finger/Zn-ribbon topoisomerase 1